MIKRIEPIDNEFTFITWEVFNKCNYSCSYCTENLHSGTYSSVDYDSALNFFNEVVLDYDDSTRRMLSIGGGEPTIWKDLTRFLSNLDKSYTVELVTNGSRTIRWWKDFMGEVDNISRVSISVHLEYADISHIINLIEFLNGKCQITVMVLYQDGGSESIRMLYDHIKSNESLKCSLRVKPVVDKFNGSFSTSYTDEQHTIFNSMEINRKQLGDKVPSELIVDGEVKTISWINNLMVNNENSFKSYNCSIGSGRLYITYDGNVFGASCSTAKMYPLGNINSPIINKRLSTVKCRNMHCPCPPDIRIPKHYE